MITNFVSLKRIISKIYLYTNSNYEISEDFITELCADALSMIGAYSQFEEITECLETHNGKAKLPCGFEHLVDISYNGIPMYWSTQSNSVNYKAVNCNIPVCRNNDCKYTFYINNSYIVSNIVQNNTQSTSNNIQITYLGIPTDEDGVIMVPDGVYFEKALMSYVISILDWQDWRKGKCTDKVYQDSEQKWLWYVNSARGQANMPNTQQTERLSAIIKRLLPISGDYETGFKNFNKREKLNFK